MFSLIAITLTIAILAAYAVATIVYTPTWASTAQVTHELVAKGFPALEIAFQLATAHQPNEEPLLPIASGDGGLQQNFRTYYGFLPKAPPGMTWSYGRTVAPGPFQQTYYFCLSGSAVTQGVLAGASRYTETIGASQLIVHSQCGAQANQVPSAAPTALALTYYVQYVPDVTGQLH